MLLAFIFFSTAIASGASDPTIDSDPDNRQGWYSAPNYRGTLDIVWPCLLTIFLCCWTAVHPDIPDPRSTWRQRYIERTMCLLLGAIAPEAFIGIAMEDRFRAKSDYELTAKQLGKENWTMTHAVYAGMGGFAIEQEFKQLEVAVRPNHVYVLEGSIITAFHTGRLDKDHWISEEAIKDKGKSDNLVKSLVLLQLIWLCVQCVARLVQHLPLTTLEISTLAYVPCTVLIYYLWWDKPYDIGVPTILHLSPKNPLAGNDHATALYCTNILNGKSTSPQTGTYLRYGMLTRIFSPRLDMPSKRLWVSSFGPLVIGAVHLAAWNFSLPTPFERTAWRACSVIVLCEVPLQFVLHLICHIFSSVTCRTHSWKQSSLDTTIGKRLGEFKAIGFIVYAIARLFLIIEAFIGLRAVPKLVYKTPEWEKFLPHFG